MRECVSGQCTHVLMLPLAHSLSLSYFFPFSSPFVCVCLYLCLFSFRFTISCTVTSIHRCVYLSIYLLFCLHLSVCLPIPPSLLPASFPSPTSSLPAPLLACTCFLSDFTSRRPTIWHARHLHGAEEVRPTSSNAQRSSLQPGFESHRSQNSKCAARAVCSVLNSNVLFPGNPQRRRVASPLLSCAVPERMDDH